MKNVFTLSLLLACTICFGQNLVPNPSFEDTIRCNLGMDNWFGNVDVWTEINTADYYNSCNATTPGNNAGFQYPASGSAYAGFCPSAAGSSLLEPNYRELIGAPLLQPLEIGKKYFVSIKVNLTFRGCATNKIGVLFTNVIYSKDTLIRPNTPFVNNFAHVYTDSIISDTLNWTGISGSFTPDSVYQYIYIGNFFDDLHTDTLLLSNIYCHSYYFLDDICVSEDSMTCFPAVGIHDPKQTAGVSLFPNPFSNQLTFTVTNNEAATVSLYDVAGRQLLQQSFTNSTTLNTAQFASGIYFYEVRNSTGVIKKGKVIKATHEN